METYLNSETGGKVTFYGQGVWNAGTDMGGLPCGRLRVTVFPRVGGELLVLCRSVRRDLALPQAVSDRTHTRRLETWIDEGNDRPYAGGDKTRQGGGDR